MHPVCGLVLRKEVVGDCSICSANLDLPWSVPASWIFTALVVTMLSWYPWYILEYSHGTVRLQQYFLNSLIRALQSRRRPLDIRMAMTVSFFIISLIKK
jgi:hypothetical protein